MTTPAREFIPPPSPECPTCGRIAIRHRGGITAPRGAFCVCPQKPPTPDPLADFKRYRDAGAESAAAAIGRRRGKRPPRLELSADDLECIRTALHLRARNLRQLGSRQGGKIGAEMLRTAKQCERIAFDVLTPDTPAASH